MIQNKSSLKTKGSSGGKKENIEDSYEILEKVLGASLMGMEYEPLFNYFKEEERRRHRFSLCIRFGFGIWSGVKMASNNGSKRLQISTMTKPPPPPPKINVQKFAESRAAELESLHSIVANRLNGDFRSHRSKRRRTTAFDSKAAKRRGKRQRRSLVGLTLVPSGDITEKKNDVENISIPRHIRRRAQLRMNPEKGFSTSGDGTKRLRTHVWHAKRFTMSKLWGYHLPLGLHGRGRGSRAVLKWFRNGVLIHDASYHVAVQLEGPERSLLSILSRVLVPSPSARSCDVSSSVISGAVYDSAMLHHIGAPISKPIAPVMYMWRPCCLRSGDNGIAAINDQGIKEAESTESHSSFRQLWVWIHASAFNEGYEALKFACQKEMEETGILINCFSLEGQLAKLEIIGLKAFQLLQKTFPITWFSEDSWQVEKHSVDEADDDSQLIKASVLENEDHVSSKAMLSLRVMDPRAVTKKGMIANVPESASSDMLKDFRGTEIGEHAGIAEILDRNKEAFPLRSESGCNSTLSCGNLWDANSGVIPPVEESVLCEEKHELLKNFFCLNDPNSTKVQCSRCCPIMLLKDDNKKGLAIGWSVILPLSWVRAFWVPLVSKGVHAIGLREKHWVACEIGLPYFPWDFPDCNAYSCLKATEGAASNLEGELRPPSTAPLRVPFPPPWDSVWVTLNRVLKTVGDPKICREGKHDGGDLTSDSECTYCGFRLLGGHGNSLDGFVARTSSSLTNFLNEVKGNNLLLYPQVANAKTCFSKIVKDERELRLAQNGVTNIIYNRKPCFLRVLLHAYKEGSFEEGAVVCAPRLTDISLWTSSSGDIEGLQIPESAVRSYFKEQSSGKSELQIPGEASASNSHRLPIGFVTTGFVRGSKRPMAEAFCEAVLLAHLRKEQLNDLVVKRRQKEIYVLVRNLRSTAYKLAHATIVLEQQGDDLESL